MLPPVSCIITVSVFCSAGVFAVVLFVVRLVVQQLAFLGVFLSFSSTLTNFDSGIVEVIELA